MNDYLERFAPSSCTKPLVERRKTTQRQLKRIAQSAGKVVKEDNEDIALVLFGSLARHEYTEGADVDWSLLVDGHARASHSELASATTKALSTDGFRAPNATGPFGWLSFSHELIHCVGGSRDSNRNTTQRVLLLLESTAVIGPAVRDRVVGELIEKYLGKDSSRHRSPGDNSRVPRFLLNDIVRYWRTIAVDFSEKSLNRDFDRWGLRNFKLRMSRKLIFVAGVLVCLTPYVRSKLGKRIEGTQNDYLQTSVGMAPLDILARACADFGAKEATTRDLFQSYEDFLCILDDREKRDELSRLRPEESASNPLFSESREIGRRFQKGLTSLFFHTNDELTNACGYYGVF